MDLAELIQRTERILAVDEQLRQKLEQTVVPTQRSLNQHLGPQTVAPSTGDATKRSNRMAENESGDATNDRPPPPS